MATQAEVTLKLNETLTVLRKVAGEVSGLQAGMDALNERIAELLAIIAAGGDASPDLVAKANEVQDAATGLDAQIPDPIVVPTA